MEQTCRLPDEEIEYCHLFHKDLEEQRLLFNKKNVFPTFSHSSLMVLFSGEAARL